MANGYMHKAIGESVRRIKKIAQIDNIMVGNVHTDLGVFNIVEELHHLKCPIYIRVGIAGGSPCATNDRAAVGEISRARGRVRPKKTAGSR
jgi:hypothetical protein